MPKPVACKHCGSSLHYSYACYTQRKPIVSKVRKPIVRTKVRIAKESKTYKQKRMATTKAWYDLNPPDRDGYWTCYLQISSECPVKVHKGTINLEHVKSKASHPELRFDTNNLAASCSPCNSLKSGQSLERLAEKHPHLAVYL